MDTGTTVTDSPTDSVSSTEIDSDVTDVCNNKLADSKMDRQTKVSSLKTLDLSEKSNMKTLDLLDKSNIPSARILKSENPSPVDSTVVAEFQRLRRLRRRHSESNLLRNESGLPGISSKGGPHRQHGLSSSLNSSGSTLSVNSSAGASISDGDAVLEVFLSPSPNALKSLDLPRNSVDKISASSPVTQLAPRPVSPNINCQVTATLSPSSMSPTAGSPMSPMSPRSLASLSPVSPRILTLPVSPINRRKPSPLTLEDPRTHRAPASLRPLALEIPRLPDAQLIPNSPQGTSTDDLTALSPKNQRRRMNSGSTKQYETTLQDIVENRPGNGGDDLLKKRLAQHPRRMLMRRNTEPPQGMLRKLKMAGLASDENKGPPPPPPPQPQGKITQEIIISHKPDSNDSIPSSICGDEQLREKCLNWLDTLDTT